MKFTLLVASLLSGVLLSTATAAVVEIDVSDLMFENDTAAPDPILPYGLTGDTSFLFDTDTLAVSGVGVVSPTRSYTSGLWDPGVGRFQLQSGDNRAITIDTEWSVADFETLAIGASDSRFPVGDEADLGGGDYFAFITSGQVTATRVEDVATPVVPLPAGLPLLLTGFAGLIGLRIRRIC